MDVYKEMFLRMSIGVENAVRELVQAQKDCENMYVESGEFTGKKPEFRLINILEHLEKKNTTPENAE